MLRYFGPLACICRRQGVIGSVALGEAFVQPKKTPITKHNSTSFLKYLPPFQ